MKTTWCPRKEILPFYSTSKFLLPPRIPEEYEEIIEENAKCCLHTSLPNTTVSC
jgi:hypothetical protein